MATFRALFARKTLMALQHRSWVHLAWITRAPYRAPARGSGQAQLNQAVEDGAGEPNLEESAVGEWPHVA
jgi:hypothetical protein